MSQHHVGAEPDSYAYVAYNREVIDDFVDLLGQVVHVGIFERIGERRSTFLLARRVDVKNAKMLQDLCHVRVVEEGLKMQKMSNIFFDKDNDVEAYLEVGNVVEAEIVVSQDCWL